MSINFEASEYCQVVLFDGTFMDEDIKKLFAPVVYPLQGTY